MLALGQNRQPGEQDVFHLGIGLRKSLARQPAVSMIWINVRQARLVSFSARPNQCERTGNFAMHGIQKSSLVYGNEVVGIGCNRGEM
jgi:hypothetical protein